MKLKLFYILTIAVILLPLIFVVPGVFVSYLTLAIPIFMLIAYLLCHFTGKQYSVWVKLTGLLSGIVLYLLIMAIYIKGLGRDMPPWQNILMIISVIAIGLILGFGLYAIRCMRGKIILAILSVGVITFSFCGGEKGYSNLIYLGSVNGNAYERLEYPLPMVDIDGQDISIENISKDQYLVIQTFGLGFGYSWLNVEKFMIPTYNRHKDDPRVRFLVLGVSTGNEYEGKVSGDKIVEIGLPYALLTDNNSPVYKQIIKNTQTFGYVAIIRDSAIIFRGDGKMAMEKLDDLLL